MIGLTRVQALGWPVAPLFIAPLRAELGPLSRCFNRDFIPYHQACPGPPTCPASAQLYKSQLESQSPCSKGHCWCAKGGCFFPQIKEMCICVCCYALVFPPRANSLTVSIAVVQLLWFSTSVSMSRPCSNPPNAHTCNSSQPSADSEIRFGPKHRDND